MSSREFVEWREFLLYEPHGFYIENWRAAQICATIASTVAGVDPRKIRLDDFMPKTAKRLDEARRVELTSEQRDFIEKRRSRRRGNRS